jgi:UDP-2,4-diacetamido-2,4,6-trideoxy-beta-L-altropyranose hydrolase
VRCLNLAEAWQAKGGEATLCAAELTAALADRALATGVRLMKIDGPRAQKEDICLTSALAADSSAVVIDGYEFDYGYQDRIRSAAPTSLVLDDAPGARRFSCDMILNPNAHADSLAYGQLVGRDCQLLMGPRYSLLPKRLWDSAPRIATGYEPLAVIVTLGGGNNTHALSFVLDLFAAHRPMLRLTILTGGSETASLQLKIQSLTHHQTSFIDDFVDDLPDKLVAADVAVTAGGGTVWEALSVGVPTAILAIADNQVASSHRLDHDGAAVLLGEFPGANASESAKKLSSILNSRDLRERLSQTARRMVDGLGAQRVADILWHRAAEETCSDGKGC